MRLWMQIDTKELFITFTYFLVNFVNEHFHPDQKSYWRHTAAAAHRWLFCEKNIHQMRDK